MLKLKGITKDYKTGATTVSALKGVSLEFRKSEFVSILGPSGCGKTTLLNIVGGLDQYTEGDLVVNGISTKKFKDSHWDAYRNHTIGFVFQSYNLIPHQSVLSNVEMALTLSGVSKAERKMKAKDALEAVGLKEHINKKPNQLSGGQMQRVAIARALVNDPEIILADEPTGALDSETSVQVMDILKKISETKLIIMVTHNPELAQEYSTRIIKLFDGRITSDSMPYDSEKEETSEKQEIKKNKSMSFFTALSLSLNNLMTKKGRSFLTAFAGSIGIIGIALILSMSNGAQKYIQSSEEDALASYPVSIQREAMDISGMMSAMTGSSDASSKKSVEKQKNGRVYSNNIMSQMVDSMTNTTTSNDLKSFKKYIEKNKKEIQKYSNEIQYQYDTQLNIYSADTSKDVQQVNPNTVLSSMGFTATSMFDANEYTKTTESNQAMTSQYDVWNQLFDNDKVLKNTYDVVKGRMPKKYDEVVIVVDKNNQMSDLSLYALGLMDQKDLGKMMSAGVNKSKKKEIAQQNFTYNKLMDLTFKMVTNTDYFEKQSDGTWKDQTGNEKYMKKVIDKSMSVKVVGVVKPSEDSSVEVTGGVGYTKALMDYLVNEVNSSDIVNQQKQNKDIDVFSGVKFSQLAINAQSNLKNGQIMKFNTYESNLKMLGVSDLDNPSAIQIYPKDFESKEHITDMVESYNEDKADDEKITYTDYIGIMMSSVTTIINAISYILIGFVSISLIVSSIMIGIITYISVLERKKEIGILRAMGASKKDVSRVFKAETLIVGFVAGAIGIGVTVLLDIPVNIIINKFADIGNVAVLPVAGGVILVVISMLLTFVAGLVPARMAAKKDPVEALRAE